MAISPRPSTFRTRVSAKPPCRQLSNKAKQKTSSPLLPLRAVLGFRGSLRGAPPGLVGAVPLDGGGEAGGEVGAGRAPAQLAAQLGAVDDIAAVVSGTVAHPVEAIT